MLVDKLYISQSKDAPIQNRSDRKAKEVIHFDFKGETKGNKTKQ